MNDKMLMLMTVGGWFIRVQASNIRVLCLGANDEYLLYVDGIRKPFGLTDVAARQAGDAMDALLGTECSV